MPSSTLYDAYLRKSEESDDRQVLSIPAQRAECEDRFPEIQPKRCWEESFSAKAPGRPIFNEMLDRVESGEIQGIVSWHPDRLARNSVDAGRIIYLLDIGKLKDLKFCSYTFENTPEGKWMLSMVMGQAKYQVDKLSVDVSRGNRQKWESGGITWAAPIGYLNEKAGKIASIIPDPDRFAVVRRMWDLLLSGVYTVAQIRKVANEAWGFRTRKTKKGGGTPLSASTLYATFRNPLYYGLNIRPDGKEYRCSHKAMISEDEFWQAQAILGKKGRPRPKLALRPYSGGLIHCGECGCSITADAKTKHYKNGRSVEYVYYRCTKKRGTCGQSYLEVRDLEADACMDLTRVVVAKNRLDWILRYCKEEIQRFAKVEDDTSQSKLRTLEGIERELANLTRMLRKEHIEEAEFLKQRAELVAERGALEGKRQEPKTAPLELIQKAFDFAFRSCYWLVHGNAAQKRAVIETIYGSNLLLTDKKLNLKPVGPFEIMARQAQYSNWWTFAEDIRTYFAENAHVIHIPDMEALIDVPGSHPASSVQMQSNSEEHVASGSDRQQQQAANLAARE